MFMPRATAFAVLACALPQPLSARLDDQRLLVVSAVSAAAPLAANRPDRVGACVITRIKSVGTRLADTPGSGSEVEFENGVLQVSYDTVEAVEQSRPGDVVTLCLIFIPEDCPPGDDRGREYKTTNMRTGQDWTLQDSQHGCGGA